MIEDFYINIDVIVILQYFDTEQCITALFDQFLIVSVRKNFPQFEILSNVDRKLFQNLKIVILL